MGREVTRGCHKLATDIKKRTSLKCHNSETSRDIVLGFSLFDRKLEGLSNAAEMKNVAHIGATMCWIKKLIKNVQRVILDRK